MVIICILHSLGFLSMVICEGLKNILNTQKIYHNNDFTISKGCWHWGRKQTLLLVFLCQLINFIPLRATGTYNLVSQLVKVFFQ